MIEGRSGALFYKTYDDDNETATISVMNKDGVKDAWANKTVNVLILKKNDTSTLKINVGDIALKGIFNLISPSEQIIDNLTTTDLHKFGKSMKRYHNICFKPNQNTSQEFNLWKGFPVDDDAYGYDVSPFLDFIYEAVGSEAEHILDFFAHMIQKPQEKPRYCLVFKG